MNVLISSAGRRVGLLRAFRAAIAGIGAAGRIVAADAGLDAPAAHLADAFHRVPRCSDKGFVGALADICRQECVGVIVPTIDTELPSYARHRDELAAQGVQVASSGAETVRIAGDKRLSHAWLRENGFPAVRQTTISRARLETHDWTFPLIAKPAAGSASLGVRRLRSRAELLALPDTEDLVVEEIAPGVEYTVHVYVDRRGRCLSAVPCRRLEVRAGEVSKGLTAKKPALMELARAIAEALPDARGPLNIQVFEAPDGSLRAIEINARFGGGYPLAHHAGARFPQWILDEAQGKPVEPAFGAWQDDLAMLRFDDAVFLSGAAIRAEPARKVASSLR